jgi:hypothetical protein
MGFKKLKDWKSDISKEFIYGDIENKGIVVLYPGSMKPMHGGHLDLIKRYADNELVKNIKILVGPGVRNGVDQAKATKIVEILIKDISNVEVEPVKWPSPVLTAYKEIESAEPGYYALLASTKGDDYERARNFVIKHGPNGKYSREKDRVYVIELPLDVEPLSFSSRDDEHNGQPISASVLRNDIVNDDFKNFSAGYPETNEKDIRFIWDELAETVMNESVANYEPIDPNNKYKNSYPIVPLTEEEEEVSEAGDGKHLMSPWESMDLTFGEIRKLVHMSLNGELEKVSEKLDGQNILATYKDGNTYLARTQKQTSNGGELAMRWDQVVDKMSEKTPEFIKKAYGQAMTDLHNVLNSSKLDLTKLFKNGHRWLNMELLNPETENIIPYGEYQLRIHNLKEVNDKGKEVKTILSGGDFDKIINDIEQSAISDKIHIIKKTNKVNFEKIKDVKNIQEGIIRKLEVIMSSNNLDDKNTLGDYLSSEISSWLTEKLKYNRFEEDPQLISDLTQRWAYDDKSKSITNILKDKDPKLSKFVKSLEKNIQDKIGNLLDPIIGIFTRTSIAVLQNLSGIAATNRDKVSEGIKRKSEDAINKIKEFMKNDPSSIKDYEKKVNYLETQLRRLEQSGGLNNITPIEGIVFDYNGKLFKLTGNYLPILKIINFFQFGKDKK